VTGVVASVQTAAGRAEGEDVNYLRSTNPSRGSENDLVSRGVGKSPYPLLEGQHRSVVADEKIANGA
jgi:hypothetical protein